MAMRSQIWEWDLYRGTPVTGSVATTTFATVCSPIKELSLWSNSTGPPFPNTRQVLPIQPAFLTLMMFVLRFGVRLPLTP